MEKANIGSGVSPNAMKEKATPIVAKSLAEGMPPVRPFKAGGKRRKLNNHLLSH